MDDDRLDLSPLGMDDLRRARMAREVMARARLGAAGTPAAVLMAVQPRTPLAELAGWARPTLAAAAVIAAVSLGALAWRPTSAGAAAGSTPLTIADGLEIPEPAADIIAEQRPVSEEDLLISWDPRP
jgi:hypothetical protein